MGTATAVIGSWVGLSVIFALLVGRAMAVAKRADPPEMPAFARRDRARLRA